MAAPPFAYQAFAFLTGFAHQAVVLLFLLSGWLVGGKLLDTVGQAQAIRHYAIDRLTRLWTVLLPCFLIMFALAIGLGEIAPTSPDLWSTAAFSGRTVLANLLGLQHIAAVDLGGNYALWTMAHQSAYYVLFPLILCSRGPGAPLGRMLAAAAALAMLWSLPGAISLYFLVWLLGAGASRIRLECALPTRLMLGTVAAGSAIYFRLFGLRDDIAAASLAQDLLLSIAVLAFLAALPLRPSGPPGRAALWERASELLAGCSFTLYVLHVPLIGLLKKILLSTAGLRQLAPESPSHYLLHLSALGAIVAISHLCSLAFERQTGAVRRLLNAALDARAWRAAS